MLSAGFGIPVETGQETHGSGAAHEIEPCDSTCDHFDNETGTEIAALFCSRRAHARRLWSVVEWLAFRDFFTRSKPAWCTPARIADPSATQICRDSARRVREARAGVRRSRAPRAAVIDRNEPRSQALVNGVMRADSSRAAPFRVHSEAALMSPK